ncbi:MAG: 50S ribosomal protein L19e [Candidatus Aenigmatarchaeota archaeon]|nr:MAG: 50S ribosomal protein L19e [Candidatus Aenigmarchaeota archaeon]
MTNIASQKRMAARIMKCGISRVRVKRPADLEEALTRDDVRNLIRKGAITKVQKKGSSRAAARKILKQKKRGRRQGAGRRKGKERARNPRKTEWVRGVRPMRGMIRELRDTGRIARGNYRKLYMMVKGGMFRNKKHIMLYLKEHEMLNAATMPVKKASMKAKTAAKAANKPAAKKPAKKKAKRATKEIKK